MPAMPADPSMTRATWWLVYATFSLVGTGLLTITFAWIQIALQRTQTRVGNLESLVQWFEGDRIRRVRQSLAICRLTGSAKLKRLDLDDVPDPADELLDFFEHMAFLVRRGHLKAFDTWHTFGPWIAAIHADFREYIAVLQVHDATTYCDFAWLFKRLVEIDRREKGSGLEYDDDDLEAHYGYESRLDGVRVPVRRKPRKRKTGPERGGGVTEKPTPEPPIEP
jgi:hypothetical protein